MYVCTVQIKTIKYAHKENKSAVFAKKIFVFLFDFILVYQQITPDYAYF